MPVTPSTGSSTASRPGRRLGRPGTLVIAAAIALVAALRVFALVNVSPSTATPSPADPPGPSDPAPAGDGKRPAPAEQPTGSDSPARPRLYGMILLAIAMLFAIFWVFSYNVVNHWYWPVSVHAVSTDLTATQQVTLTPARARPDVSWSLDGGWARQLILVGSGSGLAQVDLPLPRSSCAKLAGALNVTCAGGQLVMGTPAFFTWSAPEQVQSPAGATTATKLYLSTTGASGGQPSVTLATRTVHTPALCFSSPGTAATLTISVGNRSKKIPVPGGQAAGCGGLSALAGVAGSGSPPAFELNDVSALNLGASRGAAAQLQGFAGSMTLTPGGTTIPGPGDISIHGSTSVSAELAIAPGSKSLGVHDPAAGSVLTGNGQLVPSVWSRQAPILGPVLGGLVTLTVVTPLGVSVQLLMDRLKRWRGPTRRRRRHAQPRTREAGHAR
jgi:hypothetical protein